jgi:hypothetical protein
MNTSCATAEGLMMLRALVPAGFFMPTGRVRRALITKLAMRSREEFLFEDETTATWQLDHFGKQIFERSRCCKRCPPRGMNPTAMFTSARSA